MASNKNPFLDDLFPDPMRARKARIFKGYVMMNPLNSKK